MPTHSLPDNRYDNVNLNALGSQYASFFSHDENKLVQRITNKILFDAQPKQFFDLKMLNMVKSEQCPSDEFFWQEVEYQREPLTATATASGVTWPTTQVVTVSNTDNVSEDLIITYPTNQKGTIIAVDKSTNQITVKPMTGQTLPAVAVSDVLANHAPVEGDSMDGFTNYFRLTTVERFNFVKMMSKAIRFGRLELFKYQNAGTLSNYLSMNEAAMYQQTRIDVSNDLWNGERGEVTLKDGKTAKTTGGIFPMMVASGSPNSTCTTSTIRDAFEDILNQTQYGVYGETKFCFMENEIAQILSKEYKDEKIRYRPQGDMSVNIMLDSVNIGAVNAVIVPFKRFADTASFPTTWRDRIIVTDPSTLVRKYNIPENSGRTLDRQGGVARTYSDSFVDLSFGLQFNNPKAFGYIDVSR